MCVAVLPSMVIFRSPMVFLLIMSKPQNTKNRCVSTPMSATPKSSWGWVKAMLHSIYDLPDAKSAHARFDRVVEALAEKLPRSPSNTTTGPKVAATSDPTSSPAPGSP